MAINKLPCIITSKLACLYCAPKLNFPSQKYLKPLSRRHTQIDSFHKDPFPLEMFGFSRSIWVLRNCQPGNNLSF